MTLIKFKEPASFAPLFDGFFNDFFGGRQTHSLMARVPAVNVRENENGYQVELAAPGLNKKDFNIEINDNVLTVSAERKEEKEEPATGNQKVTRKEFSYTSFRRSFSLPESVDGENIKASYQDGILGIELPKKEEEKAKNRVIKIS